MTEVAEELSARTDVQRYELLDPMPDVVREGARKFTSIQALNELIGSPCFFPWPYRAPSYARKQMLIAKMQDEIGHGHAMVRLAADLGTTWEEILVDYLEGRSFLHNVFHYPFDSWEEFGTGALLMNSAAIVQFQSLMQGAYLPYSRALRKIAREESFHYQHAVDIVWEVMNFGDESQRRRVQRSFETWFVRALAFLGPPDTDTIKSNVMWQVGLKPHSNDEQRQQWIGKIVPVFRKLGVTVDADLAIENEPGVWSYRAPDWVETKQTIRNGGPASDVRMAHARKVLDRHVRYRHVEPAGA